MGNKEEVSVIIPTCRKDIFTLSCIRSVCLSLSKFPNKKELILCVDRSKDPSERFFDNLILEFPFVKIIYNTSPRGSAFIRNEWIKCSQYNILLFTDDDSIVPENWVEAMTASVKGLWNCTWRLVGNKTNLSLMHKFEEYIDDIRTSDIDASGEFIYVSFPCFGIKRSLLPCIPFDTSSNNTIEDMDLGSRLRLNNIPLFYNPDIVVIVDYPHDLKSTLIRKLKHAKGFSYLRKKYWEQIRTKLWIGSNRRLFIEWVILSRNSPFKSYYKLYFWFINCVFCLWLFYYYIKFFNIKPYAKSFYWLNAK